MIGLQYGQRRKEQTHRGKEEDSMRKTTACAFLCAAMIAGLAAGCGAKTQDTEGGKTAAGAEAGTTAGEVGTGDGAVAGKAGTGDGTAVGEAGAGADGGAAESDSDGYTPVTITLNLERSGLGENVEYTFTERPSHVVASGDQMADFFFDLGVEDCMAGYTKGSAWSLVSQYPARDQVPQLLEPGKGLGNLSKEELLATRCDFLIGWDSVFSDKNFNSGFCRENGIAMYFPYVCSDSAVFEDLYKDYETLGQIFRVEELAAEKIQGMEDKLQDVQEALGEEAYEDPIKVFVYDSGEDAPFTACQGMPGDILKHAGGISIFDNIQAGWATPSWEEVVERDPEVILVLDYEGDGEVEEKIRFLKTHDATKDLTAVKEGRIYSACCADMQGSAGSAGTVEVIAEQLYPERFR